MMLDECIKRYEIWASDDRIEKDIREEHEQIAEWLKDYKRLLEQEPYDDAISRKQAIDKMQELEDEDIKAYGCEIPEGFDGRRAIKALKTLPPVAPKSKTDVLDRIRTEIEQRPYGVVNDSVLQGIKYERTVVLEIIDKYTAESEK